MWGLTPSIHGQAPSLNRAPSPCGQWGSGCFSRDPPPRPRGEWASLGCPLLLGGGHAERPTSVGPRDTQRPAPVPPNRSARAACKVWLSVPLFPGFTVVPQGGEQKQTHIFSGPEGSRTALHSDVLPRGTQIRDFPLTQRRNWLHVWATEPARSVFSASLFPAPRVHPARAWAACRWPQTTQLHPLEPTL